MFPFKKKYDFAGKVALVTGSSGNIGAEIAIHLAKYGAQLVITGRNDESKNLELVAERIFRISGGLKPLQIIGNLLDDSFPMQLINKTIAKFARIDILVNSAGSTEMALHDKPIEEFSKFIKLDLIVPVQLTQLAMPFLEKTKGTVINIANFSIIKQLQGTLPYCTAKAILDMYTKFVADELWPKGIRVNSINSGTMESLFARSMPARSKHENTFESAYEGSLMKYRVIDMLKCIDQPEDIAPLASFLASDEANNVTGQIYVNNSAWMW